MTNYFGSNRNKLNISISTSSYTDGSETNHNGSITCDKDNCLIEENKNGNNILSKKIPTSKLMNGIKRLHQNLINVGAIKGPELSMPKLMEAVNTLTPLLTIKITDGVELKWLPVKPHFYPC